MIGREMGAVVRSIEASGMTTAQLNVFLKMSITGRVTVQHMIELNLAGISTADYNKAVLQRAKDTQ